MNRGASFAEQAIMRTIVRVAIALAAAQARTQQSELLQFPALRTG
jgi:hypothetical protein